MKNLAKALLNAQKSMVGAVKDSKNPFFKSNYADLSSVIDASLSCLHDNDIVVVQPTIVLEGKQYVETKLIHAESGETLSGFTLIVTKNDNDAQQYGAGQTYARRFGLQSIVVLKTLDDDGNMAAGKTVSNSTIVNVKASNSVGGTIISGTTTQDSNTTTVTLDGKAPVGNVPKFVPKRGPVAAKTVASTTDDI